MNGHTAMARAVAVIVFAAIEAVTEAPASAQQDPTTLVSVSLAGVAGNGPSTQPSLSADARYVAFTSDASDLVVGDTNGVSDIFVRDRLTGLTRRMSLSSFGVQGNGSSEEPSISADGRLVAFRSTASNFTVGDTLGFPDIFVHDRLTGQTTQVSVSSTGTMGNGVSLSPRLSGDGSRVIFQSKSTNLVPPPDDSAPDIYVHTLATQATVRLSAMTAGAADFNARSGSLSFDGNRASWNEECEVIFGCAVLRLRDFTTGTTTMLAEVGVENSSSSISGDGQFVAFDQASTIVVDTDTLAQETVGIGLSGTPGSTFGRPSVSEDGRFVAFTNSDFASWPDPLNDDRQVYVRDRLLQQSRIVSLDATGTIADDDCSDPNLSADGRYAAYSSKAQNLAANDGNGLEDVFLHAPLEPWTDLGFALPGAGGAPDLVGIGPLEAGSPTHVVLSAAAPLQPALLFASVGSLPAPFKGGTLAAVPPFVALPLATGAQGGILLSFDWPGGVPSGTQITVQYAVADAGAVQDVALSNASQATAP